MFRGIPEQVDLLVLPVEQGLLVIQELAEPVHLVIQERVGLLVGLEYQVIRELPVLLVLLVEQGHRVILELAERVRLDILEHLALKEHPVIRGLRVSPVLLAGQEYPVIQGPVEQEHQVILAQVVLLEG